jgi:hypothetical protein
MNERQHAWNIANRWLAKGDQFGAFDPDGDQCVVARQYMRALDKIARLSQIVRDSPPWPSFLDAVMREIADEWPKAIQP